MSSKLHHRPEQHLLQQLKVAVVAAGQVAGGQHDVVGQGLQAVAAWPRTSSNTSGFFLWGMMLEPVVKLLRQRPRKPNPGCCRAPNRTPFCPACRPRRQWQRPGFSRFCRAASGRPRCSPPGCRNPFPGSSFQPVDREAAAEARARAQRVLVGHGMGGVKQGQVQQQMLGVGRKPQPEADWAWPPESACSPASGRFCAPRPFAAAPRPVPAFGRRSRSV